jgi:hypothetical protein
VSSINVCSLKASRAYTPYLIFVADPLLQRIHPSPRL